MPLDPRRMLLLRTVRRTGSVLAAARALHLTPSGVSQHLGKLEAEAGVSLIDREQRGGGRSIRLTPAGHALADHADAVAEALTAAERGVAELRESPAGPLRIGGFSVALSEIAVPVAMRMAVADPSIDPCVFEVSDAEGIRMLTEGELDLLLTDRSAASEPDRSGGLVEVDLVRDPFEVIVPSTWPADSDPATLLARPWITTSFGPATRKQLERMCHEYSLTLTAHDIGTGSAPTLLALVANGLGATIIPALTLRQNATPDVRISKAIIAPGSRLLTAVHREDAPPTVSRVLVELQRYVADELQVSYPPGHP
ncbi:hypothetical protein CFN78_25895 [Amycolatopsis antarctica]|uniref:HTH lysR-type domain-containing protein n=1 Tax=Amycolatopsis antarctica TaxID=1854586 RepID=A0A263CYF0_9PSEU|nr:LysR family transcriptional regulator [Amycolatopsis antarctica]OZM70356.1 hypothetical protein CFN78_25895 [Amycolatopsis antarctica]